MTRPASARPRSGLLEWRHRGRDRFAVFPLRSGAIRGAGRPRSVGLSPDHPGGMTALAGGHRRPRTRPRRPSTARALVAGARRRMSCSSRGDATYLCHRLIQSGLAAVLPASWTTVWVSAGSMVLTRGSGRTSSWPARRPDDRTLGVVDFDLPHPPPTTRWPMRSGGTPRGGGVRPDDQPGIRVDGDVTDVVPEGMGTSHLTCASRHQPDRRFAVLSPLTSPSAGQPSRGPD